MAPPPTDDQLGFFPDDPAPAPARPTLVVVPRRAMTDPGAWTAPPDLIGGAVLCTFEEFLERVRLITFVRHAALVRNDDARLWAAALELARQSPWGARLAVELARLSRGFTDERVGLSEVVPRLAGQGARQESIADLLKLAGRVQGRMERSLFVDRSYALALAMDEVEIPPSLLRYRAVRIDKVVEPTRTELSCVLGLADRGLPLEYVLPLDVGGGFSPAVRWIADEIEKHYEAPHLELFHEPLGEGSPTRDFVETWYTSAVTDEALTADLPVRVERVSTAAKEARRIAGVVSHWARTADEAPRIAVLLRNLDKSADRIEDELSAFGLDVRRREGRPLLDTPAGRALLDLFELRRDGAPRDQVLALLSRIAYRHRAAPETLGRVARALRTAVARADAEDSTRPEGGYRHRLERFLQGNARDEEKDRARMALDLVEATMLDVRRIKRRATLRAYLQCARSLAEEALVEAEGAGTTAVRETLDEAERTVEALLKDGDDEGVVELSAFTRLLERVLAEQKTRPAPERNLGAVEMMSLPAAFGLRFDYVVIADCVHQKLPSPERKNPLFPDADKILVNKSLGQRVLWLDEADSIEPGAVAPRQALELLWFKSAAAAADKGLLITASVRDEKGRERAVSDFFEASLIALGAEPGAAQAGPAFAVDAHPKEATLALGRALKDQLVKGEPLVIDDDRAGLVARTVQMVQERTKFFAARPGEDKSAPFAFRVDAARVHEQYGHLLGLKEERPLTPTRLEALAQCPFKGFVEHMAKVDTNPEGGQDADARVLGSLAHKVLERYYRSRKERQVAIKTYNADEKARLLALVDEEAAPLLAGKETGHLAALSANIDWLKMSLSRTVANLARTPPVPDVVPLKFEGNIGVHKRGAPPPAAPAVPIEVSGRTLYIGGEIDRVDASPPSEDGRRKALVVVDYKNSTGQAVRSKVWSKKILTEHFQLPLYLRLVAHGMKKGRPELYAYLVSLRDGEASDVLGKDGQLTRRVLDDHAEDGLAHGLGRVLDPLFEGRIEARPSRTCRFCRLARACKKDDAFAAPEDAS